MKALLTSLTAMGLSVLIGGVALANGGPEFKIQKECKPIVFPIVQPTPPPSPPKCYPPPSKPVLVYKEQPVLVRVDVPTPPPPPEWIEACKFNYSFKGWDSKWKCFIYYCPETARFYRLAEAEQRYYPVG